MIVYGQDIKIEPTDNLGGDGKADSVELFYKNEGKWVYIARVYFYYPDKAFKDFNSGLEFVSKMMNEFNEKIQEKFEVELPEKPTSGIELLQYLLTQITVENNKLVLKQNSYSEIGS